MYHPLVTVQGSLCPGEGGGFPDRPPDRDPRTETPGQRPPEGTWDQSARQAVTSYRDPVVDRQTPVKTLPYPKLHLREVKTRTLRKDQVTEQWKKEPVDGVSVADWTTHVLASFVTTIPLGHAHVKLFWREGRHTWEQPGLFSQTAVAGGCLDGS